MNIRIRPSKGVVRTLFLKLSQSQSAAPLRARFVLPLVLVPSGGDSKVVGGSTGRQLPKVLRKCVVFCTRLVVLFEC